MTPDVWYVAGNGLLVGAERRWLLLDDVPDEAFVATLWEPSRAPAWTGC